MPLLVSANTNSSAVTYVEGQDYTHIAGIPEAQQPVVREFFSYNCPHCYRQDALFEQTATLLGKDIVFVRTPVGAGRESWILSQKAYYLAQTFKVTRQVHGAIFKRIHEQEGSFKNDMDLVNFFVKQGLEVNEVKATLVSVDASLALSNYDLQAQLSGIRGVPSLLVNGQYLISSISQTPEQLSKLIQYLSQLPIKTRE
ncbi:thiol:disulfide interchange protein DsbA/DsbL [Shewanella surugensis]|uniref:Thiol:disulfide interchange protein n=2 Tax=Shewanella surugensis TaxID=212020 RepID=A0ABT0LCR9_9GAMM|nr:thiol:disulfide interchange protein DsbA/DsbL [Shewanella surugensis]MCL1125280.1 thiol:disulfide interchange protein DsbA/DsbL [Shewanella surugensis]